jgi:alkaline phosphatase D
MKKIIASFVFLISYSSFGQIISGPMLGHTDFRTSTVWMQFDQSVKEAALYYNLNGKNVKRDFAINSGDFKTATATLVGLEPSTTYTYNIVVNNKKDTIASGKTTTQTLWQWREKTTPLPTFSFLAGSCVYVNNPVYDRPGKAYGNDTAIFDVMAKENASFMLWLGDNWYTREVDYYSEWGLHNRPSSDRARPFFRNIMKAMPNYAIWDDHDYGFNDADKSYPLKETSREVFKKFWTNPSYGQNNQGIYSKFTFNDADVFLLDDRWWRSNDEMQDSINGKPNPNKKMYGAAQLDWLKNALLQSNANQNITFRFIATGSQVLNPVSPFDCFRKFSAEYNELMSFLKENKINGVVFLTGDRHHSEIIKVDRDGTYPLIDITASPLTSGSHKFGGVEKNNPYRLVGVEDMQNYTKITLKGLKKERVLQVEIFNPIREKQANWEISLKELTTPKAKD